VAKRMGGSLDEIIISLGDLNVVFEVAKTFAKI
jgi:hypothetical protein